MTSHTYTPEANRKANAARRSRLTQAAQQAGYSSIDRLAQAILRGEITMNSRTHKNLMSAKIQAVRNASHWMGGAVVVKDADGCYSTIPGAHLNDISYQGSRQIVSEYASEHDVTGEYNAADLDDDIIAETIRAIEN
jgi:hypothetical protein